MLELNKIYCMDCLEGMKQLDDGSVNAVICDPPYGTMKGFNCGAYNNVKYEWDTIIPTQELFREYQRILKRGGYAILFSQEPYTSHLRTFHQDRISFIYPMIWKKNKAGNVLTAKHAPLSFFEDINVFKRDNRDDVEKSHPLRSYAKKILDYIGIGLKDIENNFTIRGILQPKRAYHFLRTDALQFCLCTEETYQLLTQIYNLREMEGYRQYDDLEAEHKRFMEQYRSTFNLQPGEKSMSNVLEFRKDNKTFHPTQKPEALIRKLVCTYTNEGDVVLDHCMGSGTTAIACMKEKRQFIGFETNKEFYERSLMRIDNFIRQKTLF